MYVSSHFHSLGVDTVVSAVAIIFRPIDLAGNIVELFFKKYFIILVVFIQCLCEILAIYLTSFLAILVDHKKIILLKTKLVGRSSSGCGHV